MFLPVRRVQRSRTSSHSTASVCIKIKKTWISDNIFCYISAAAQKLSMEYPTGMCFTSFNHLFVCFYHYSGTGASSCRSSGLSEFNGGDIERHCYMSCYESHGRFSDRYV